MKESSGPLSLTDTRLLLYLFVGLRLLLLIAHQPNLIPLNNGTVERGITVYGDFAYHFGIAEYTRLGLLPYRDFWYEYPPLIPMLSGGVYALSGGSFNAYANLLAVIFLLFDVGNLLLVRGMGRALYGSPQGDLIGWVYALMPAPLILGFWNFESVVTFGVLLSLRFLIAPKATLAGGVIALGALTKFLPLALIGAAWRFLPRPGALRVTVISLVITTLGLGAVLWFAPRYGGVSLTAQFNKASFQTVWALIDGNYITGTFNNERFDPTQASTLRGNPAVIPAWLRLIIVGGVGGLIYLTTRRRDGRGLIAFGAITLILVYLWSSGWSTQWQATLIPLILLALPDRNGVMLTLALSAFSFVEYPLIFVRGVDAGGVLQPAFVPLFSLAVVARTGVLVITALLLYLTLRTEVKA